jgi:hypothetical protein
MFSRITLTFPGSDSGVTNKRDSGRTVRGSNYRHLKGSARQAITDPTGNPPYSIPPYSPVRQGRSLIFLKNQPPQRRAIRRQQLFDA